MEPLTEPPELPAAAALFVDFDGTLVPLAPRPQDVSVPAWVVPTLERLHERLGGALAVVSGRPIEQLDHFLAPLRLPAAGVHGVQRRSADGRLALSSAVPPAGPLAVARALAEQHAGLLFEAKPGGFALHFRARPELGVFCLQTMRDAMRQAPVEWQLMEGHAVAEVKQRAVSKGTALDAFLAEPPFAGRTPIYIGDDVTDEDGIRAAQTAGGFGVRVGGEATGARHRLADTDAVARWLTAAASAPFDVRAGVR